MKYSNIACILPIIAITACGSSTPPTESYTDSSFEKVSATGTLAGLPLSSPVGALNETGIDGNGYSIAVGLGSDNKYHGYAGIIQTGVIASPPTTGSVVMSGKYYAALYTSITETNGVPSGSSATDFNHDMTATIDFAAGTMIGEGDGQDLTINGTFSGTDINGTVTYFGVTGALDGILVPTQAIGIFHGHDDTMVYAGGFVIDAP
ncbi:MAG: hypothetical protein V3V13_10485 [Paracoccaceae bacterium]